jgi:hypothetical protein
MKRLNHFPVYISVIGVGQPDAKVESLAYEVGRLIAERGAILVCGGLGGVMDSAAKGAREAGGLTVGILPGETRLGASKYLDVSIPTGMGQARNALVVLSGDGVIAIGAGYGTLSEIGFALKMGKPIVGLATWELSREAQPIKDLIKCSTPEEAVDKIFKLILRSS